MGRHRRTPRSGRRSPRGSPRRSARRRSRSKQPIRTRARSPKRYRAAKSTRTTAVFTVKDNLATELVTSLSTSSELMIFRFGEMKAEIDSVLNANIIVHAHLNNLTLDMFNDSAARVIHIVPFTKPNGDTLNDFARRTAVSKCLLIVHLKERIPQPCEYDHVIFRHHDTQSKLMNIVIDDIDGHTYGTPWANTPDRCGRDNTYSQAIKKLGVDGVAEAPLGWCWKIKVQRPVSGKQLETEGKGVDPQIRKVFELVRQQYDTIEKTSNNGKIIWLQESDLQTSPFWLNPQSYFYIFGYARQNFITPVNLFWLFMRFGSRADYEY